MEDALDRLSREGRGRGSDRLVCLLLLLLLGTLKPAVGAREGFKMGDGGYTAAGGIAAGYGPMPGYMPIAYPPAYPGCMAPP